MLAECGISTQKWQKIQKKGYRQSPESVSQFPEIVSQFSKNVSRNYVPVSW